MVRTDIPVHGTGAERGPPFLLRGGICTSRLWPKFLNVRLCTVYHFSSFPGSRVLFPLPCCSPIFVQKDKGAQALSFNGSRLFSAFRTGPIFRSLGIYTKKGPPEFRRVPKNQTRFSQRFRAMNRISIAAVSAREASPPGARRFPPTPLRMPFRTAQQTAVSAYGLTSALSINVRS